eukprot:CAMPEP_0173245952 /NCGR_PEP_ID=MMETSP1142-20121109/17033_1 /TAXON_ID=483371 /ORGANISM="non described non described, Strain CCMP2298" /LENGTH=108 /DNA_ID=CAMNT_0014178093 /DNA_START=197 /DNA_END=523 /DNA_ORIENTATION=-
MVSISFCSARDLSPSPGGPGGPGGPCASGRGVMVCRVLSSVSNTYSEGWFCTRSVAKSDIWNTEPPAAAAWGATVSCSRLAASSSEAGALLRTLPCPMVSSAICFTLK